MEFKMVLRVILPLSIIIMACDIKAQMGVDIIINLRPGVSSCQSYTPVSKNWDFFSKNCYLRYTKGPRGSPAGFKCAHMNIQPRGLLPIRLRITGASSFTRTFTGQTTATTTRYTWVQTDPDKALVESLDLNLFQQQHRTVIMTDKIVADNDDGYVMIRCPTQLLGSCELPSDTFICTYHRRAPSTAVDQLVRLAGAAGVDIYNIVQVNQDNCPN